MDKKAFLDHLNSDTFCRVGRSKISGVGVIAIRPIPKNTNPFVCFPPKEDNYIDLTEDEISQIHPSVQRFIKDFFIKDQLQTYPVNASGLNDLNISFFVNHSLDCNLEIKDIAETQEVPNSLNTFLTKRDIDEGEELTCNYKELLGVNINTDQFNFLSEKNEASISIHQHEGGKI